MIGSLKLFISKLLCSDFTGRIIAWVYADSIPFYGTRIDTSNDQVKNRIKALLFWRMYESSEIRFVQKYLTDQYDVIELGSSIGAVSVQLGKKTKGKHLIAVEANAKLISSLKNNLASNHIEQTILLNAAYGSTGEKVWFEFGEENILGKISTQTEGKAGQWIDSISLASIISKYELKEYALVCDIEGAEIDLLLHEQAALQYCKLLIIETHSTEFKGEVYSPTQLQQLLLDMGFKVIDQHGVNLVLVRA